MQYSRGELRDKELSINLKREKIHACFLPSSTKEFQFKIKREKSHFFATKSYGKPIRGSSLARSGISKESSCIDEVIQGSQIRIVMIVTEEILSFKWNGDDKSWKIIPDPSVYNHGD